MTFDKIRLEFTHDERVARLTLASPKGNIVDRAMIAELNEAFCRCAGRELNAIVVTADGPHFSFGASVQEHQPDEISATLHALHALLRLMYRVPAPLIAAVRGQCLGGGFELALACDLIMADRSAQFASPEIKLGVFAPAASALLPKRIAPPVASLLLLTGTAISAEEAARYGLVTKVVSDLEAGLCDWLESDFLPRSASSLKFASRAARLTLRRAFEEDLAELEQLYLSDLCRTPDAIEGIRAFLDKRKPQWSTPTPARR